jgi:hypothetical protein
LSKYGKYIVSGALSILGVGVTAGTSDRELVSSDEGLSATAAAQMLREKYIPAVEAATEANEELVESNEDVTLSAPKPKITPVSGIATDSRNLGGLSGGIALDKEALATQIADVSAFALGLAKMRQEAENIAETGIDIANILQNAFQGIASGISNAVTALIEGVDFKPLAAFVNLLGDALQQLGEALVSYAGAQIAAKTALVSMQWPVALAAGAAAIAAGAALKSLVKKKLEVPALASGGLAYAPTLAVVGDNRGAASDPEVIAPLSKLRQYMGGPSLELAGNVTLRVDGYDLVAVLNRTNTHLKYRG